MIKVFKIFSNILEKKSEKSLGKYTFFSLSKVCMKSMYMCIVITCILLFSNIQYVCIRIMHQIYVYVYYNTLSILAKRLLFIYIAIWFNWCNSHIHKKSKLLNSFVWKICIKIAYVWKHLCMKNGVCMKTFMYENS